MRSGMMLLCAAINVSPLAACSESKTAAERCQALEGTLCDNSCANLQSDNAHCGTCDNACTQGQFCSAGVCSDGCAAWGGTICGSQCVDTQADNDNCGACALACKDGFSCRAGACTLGCQQPQIVCTVEAESRCLDPTSDGQNCGQCGVVCDDFSICHEGACVSPYFDTDPCIVYTAAAKNLPRLFDAIAEQPDAADDLIAHATTQLVWPSDTSTLCCDAQAARVTAMAYLFDSIALQPEAYEKLMTAAALLGPSPTPPAECCELTAARYAAGTRLYDSIARQPAVASTLQDTAAAVLGTAPAMADLCPQANAQLAASISSLFTSIARQPEASSELFTAYDFLAPTGTAVLSCEDQSPSTYALEGFYDGLARNPDAQTLLFDAASRASAFLTNDEGCCAMQIQKMDSANVLFASIASNPAVYDGLAQAIALYAPPPIAGVTPSRCCEAEAKRMYSVAYMLYDVALNPDALEPMRALADAYIGSAPPLGDLCTLALARRQDAIGILYTSIARNPAIEPSLISIAETYLGTP